MRSSPAARLVGASKQSAGSPVTSSAGEGLWGLRSSLKHLQTGGEEGGGLGLGSLFFLSGIQELLHVTGGAKQHVACGLHAKEGPAEHFSGRQTARHAGQI